MKYLILAPFISAAGGAMTQNRNVDYVYVFTGTVDGPFGYHKWTAGYKSPIEKQDELGEVGYYRVKLFDYKELSLVPPPPTTNIRNTTSTTMKNGVWLFMTTGCILSSS